MTPTFNMRFFIFALLTLILQVTVQASPLADVEPSTGLSELAVRGPTYANGTSPLPHQILARTFNPDTIDHWQCAVDMPQYSCIWDTALNDGLLYLRGINWCDAPAHTCVRVSCSWNTGIFLCNERDDHIFVTCTDVAAYAQWVADACDASWLNNCWQPNQHTKGWVFDKGNWNVAVVGSSC